MNITARRVHTGAGYLVWHLSIKWQLAVDRALKRLGLTHADYLILASLHECSRCGVEPDQRELANFAGLEVAYVSKLVRSLEHSGLLRRADHTAEPRACRLELSPRGAEVVVRAAAVMRELYDRLLSPIGGRAERRQAALMRTLEALVEEADAFNRGKRDTELQRLAATP